MRIDRSHTPWILFVVAASAASALLFLANFFPQNLPFAFSLPAFFGEVPPVRHTFGGTPLGIIFGSIAFLIFLFASALGIRKKRRRWPIGNVQIWLKAHIWLTTLTLPLVLFHCGFHFGGTQTSSLMVLYIFVMASGFFGLALQQVLPKVMKDRLTREVVFEQIPFVCELIYKKACKVREELIVASRSLAAENTTGGSILAAGLDEDDSSVQILADFLDQECLPYLAGTARRRSRLADEKGAESLLGLLKINVSSRWQESVAEIKGWCDDRRTMELQTRLHHWLHGWLIIHIPTSFALLVVTAWHAWVAVRFLVVLPH